MIFRNKKNKIFQNNFKKCILTQNDKRKLTDLKIIHIICCIQNKFKIIKAINNNRKIFILKRSALTFNL